jgi:hypothetical protein
MMKIKAARVRTARTPDLALPTGTTIRGTRTGTSACELPVTTILYRADRLRPPALITLFCGQLRHPASANTLRGQENVE